MLNRKIPVKKKKGFREIFPADLRRKGTQGIASLSKDQNVGQTARNNQKLQSKERNGTFFSPKDKGLFIIIFPTSIWFRIGEQVITLAAFLRFYCL